jgi:hypothetical protein
MIKVCVFKEFIVDNDDNTFYQKWLNSELGKWVVEHSQKVETFFSFSHNTLVHELRYIAKFSEQDYCMLQLKFSHLLPH